jgi:hypothetical protein
MLLLDSSVSLILHLFHVVQFQYGEEGSAPGASHNSRSISNMAFNMDRAFHNYEQEAEVRRNPDGPPCIYLSVFNINIEPPIICV